MMAAGTSHLPPRQGPVAGDVLAAVGTREFEVSHKRLEVVKSVKVVRNIGWIIVDFPVAEPDGLPPLARSWPPAG